MKRLVAVAPGLNEAEELKFKDELGADIGWWHQLSGTWLIADPTDAISASDVLDKLYKVAGDQEFVVLEVEPLTWATRLKFAKHEANAAWMKKHWDVS